MYTSRFCETLNGYVPTLAEMARIKAWLLATRHSVRDYLDTVVLFERLGQDGVRAALRPFDEIYQQGAETSPLRPSTLHFLVPPR